MPYFRVRVRVTVTVRVRVTVKVKVRVRVRLYMPMYGPMSLSVYAHLECPVSVSTLSSTDQVICLLFVGYRGSLFDGF